MLLENGAGVNAVNGNKETALHVAVRDGDGAKYVDVAKVLLENGADVNAVNDTESTALHIACLSGNVDLVKVLLQNDADINVVRVRYPEGTALCVAGKLGSTGCVLQLLCFGAEIE